MWKPSKNGVFRSSTYHWKSLWKILAPCKKVSRTAFNRDLVVTVSQPQLDNQRSPNLLTNVIRLLWRYTEVLPSSSFSTRVLDLLQLWPFDRLQIAFCISLSIFLMMCKDLVNKGLQLKVSQVDCLQDVLAVCIDAHCTHRHPGWKDCPMLSQSPRNMQVLRLEWEGL